MNSSHPEGNNKDMIKWYEFNMDCMTRKGIKTPAISCYSNISNTTFLDTESNRAATAVVEEGAESCPSCNSKKTVSVDVQKRSADEGMTTLFECSECHNKWQT